MIWHFIATIVAGFGAAGIALLLRKLSRNKAPRYLTPVFAGLGMLMFQIYSEYQWFAHQKSLLPAELRVVMAVEETTAWRPWTYLHPQTTRFMAADFGTLQRNQHNPAIVLVDLYLFAEKSPAVPVKQLVHCQANKRADLTADLAVPEPGASLDNRWFDIPPDHPLLAVCQQAD